ncbi:hypothetical protein A9978_18720 [Pseudomonas sp. UMC65]|nr:hypothetical protein [Pseudomonas sp. UMC65]
MALAAGAIVVLIRCLFNCHGLDVCICPLVEFVTVEGNALFPNGEFADVWADSAVENCSTHAEVGGRMLCPDEARCGL